MAYTPSLQDIQEVEAPVTGMRQQAQANPSLPMRILGDVGSGAAQALFGLDKLINPSISIEQKGGLLPPTPTGQQLSGLFGVKNPNLADNLLQGAVSFAPYAAGGEGLLAAKGAESLPLLARAAKQALIGNTYGVTQSNDPLMGGTIGAVLGAGGEALPPLIRGTGSLIGKGINAIKPQKQAEQILDTLGGGNTLESNAQSLASDIRNGYQQQVQQAKNQYAPLFNALGNNPIYNRVAPIFGISQKGNYENLAKSSRNNYDGDLKDLHDAFIANPSLNNAHQLQSQLGANIGSLSYQNAKGMLDQAGKNTLQAYQRARGALLNDINSYLGSQGLDAVSAYRSAANNWQNNVVPYLADSNLAQIAKGEISNPSYSQINSIFKNPEPEIQKVIGDVGASANNKILYNELGKTQANLTPEKLNNAFSQLDNKGLDSYVTPEIAQLFNQLSKKTAARNTARTITGAILGAHFGGPVGAAAGAIASPLITAAARKLPTIGMPLLPNAVGAALGLTYRPLMNAITANTVNALGGQ